MDHPEFEPRRYDTWFFVAALPSGQRTRNASSEADRTVWIRPEDAAAGYDKGELLMMPPTIATLRTLAAYDSRPRRSPGARPRPGAGSWRRPGWRTGGAELAGA